jgi:hypothetical protein
MVKLLIKPNKILDIEWKVIYIGSAEDEIYDQVLDSVLIGPLQVGSMKFVLEVYKNFKSIKGTSCRP